MIELVALWFLGRGVTATADAKRRDRGWVALVFGGWVLAELGAWLLARRMGLDIVPAYVIALVVGAAAGMGVVAWLRGLPALPAFDPRGYDKVWSEGTCPRCASEQTYWTATTIRCFSCDYQGKPARGRPKVSRRAAHA